MKAYLFGLLIAMPLMVGAMESEASSSDDQLRMIMCMLSNMKSSAVGQDRQHAESQGDAVMKIFKKRFLIQRVWAHAIESIERFLPGQKIEGYDTDVHKTFFTLFAAQTAQMCLKAAVETSLNDNQSKQEQR